jgi:L-ascorbate metabolism protein UlaG (beta-lactamase superfamily)
VFYLPVIYFLIVLMNISWFGLSSFKIIGKDITIITDPFGKSTGLTAVRGAADVVVCSNAKSEWCNNFSSISGNPFIIQGPGEYDIKGSFIIGTAAENKELGALTIYNIELEDLRIAFLGPIKQTQLTDLQKETFEGADIVLVPVGGKQILDYENAAKIATQLEPFFVIPHSHKTPGLSLNLDKLDKFLKEMGGRHEEMDKLTIKKKELTGESTSLIVLSPQR